MAGLPKTPLNMTGMLTCGKLQTGPVELCVARCEPESGFQAVSVR